MDENERSQEMMRDQLTFLTQIKDSMKDLDDRIRGASLFLALKALQDRHQDVKDWDLIDRPDEAMVRGSLNGSDVVIGKVRTLSLHGKSSLGGRQHDSMKRIIENLGTSPVEYRYLFLLDPWTVDVIRETFKSDEVTIMPLLDRDLSPVIRSAVLPGQEGVQMIRAEPMEQMVEEVITKDADIPDDMVMVSPISRTSIRQGFLYIPKDKGERLQAGPVKVWIRKDASLDSKCMISQTGGVRIGGGLTKWFRGLGLAAGDELVMGILDESSVLVLMIRRKTPFRGVKPAVETVKW
ncbi:MAG: hypothetical protein ACMUIG_02375 [Thermoplasmatota archaeon]